MVQVKLVCRVIIDTPTFLGAITGDFEVPLGSLSLSWWQKLLDQVMAQR